MCCIEIELRNHSVIYNLYSNGAVLSLKQSFEPRENMLCDAPCQL